MSAELTTSFSQEQLHELIKARLLQMEAELVPNPVLDDKYAFKVELFKVAMEML